MSHSYRHIKFLLLIVVSLLLTTIFSCSSRRMHKTETTETSADKRNVEVKSDSVSNTTKSIASTNTSLLEQYKHQDSLIIDYVATFDKNGNLLPFQYTKESNGNKTSVSITGTAKVHSSEVQTKKEEKKVDTKQLEEQLASVVKVNSILQEEINTLKYSKTKEVKVAPDYLKYIILLGVGILLLSGAIVVVVIYFKNTIGKYKSLLNTIT